MGDGLAQMVSRADRVAEQHHKSHPRAARCGCGSILEKQPALWGELNFYLPVMTDIVCDALCACLGKLSVRKR